VRNSIIKCLFVCSTIVPVVLLTCFLKIVKSFVEILILIFVCLYGVYACMHVFMYV
jgi:hypothetical protein